jgi:hypothetical protein
MSKSKKSMQRDWYEDDENDFSMIAKDRERRKNKRLTNALRSKNIDDLLRLEDDEEE